MPKYYEAYEERYKQVHAKGLMWSPNTPTKLVEKTIKKYKLDNAKLLELGCGEGRDAIYLLNKDYNILATDISKEAIDFCQKKDQVHKNSYKVLNALDEKALKDKYDFIYSVAVLHMLVMDDDRNNFYKFIHNHLNDNGYSLILTMGNGQDESKSDIKNAFDITKRNHDQTGKVLEVATTSCRIVNFDTLSKEITSNNFEIVEHGVTNIPNHFNQIMYVVIKKLTNKD